MYHAFVAYKDMLFLPGTPYNGNHFHFDVYNIVTKQWWRAKDYYTVYDTYELWNNCTRYGDKLYMAIGCETLAMDIYDMGTGKIRRTERYSHGETIGFGFSMTSAFEYEGRIYCMPDNDFDYIFAFDCETEEWEKIGVYFSSSINKNIVYNGYLYGIDDANTSTYQLEMHRMEDGFNYSNFSLPGYVYLKFGNSYPYILGNIENMAYFINATNIIEVDLNTQTITQQCPHGLTDKYYVGRGYRFSSCNIYNNKLYCPSDNCVYIYSPSSNTLKTSSTVPTSLESIGGFYGSHLYEGKIYCISDSGYDGDFILVYDIKSDSWEKIVVPDTMTGIPMLLASLFIPTNVVHDAITKKTQGDKVMLTWEDTKNPEGTHYDIFFYNGEGWVMVKGNFDGKRFLYTIPINCTNTLEAKYKVRAYNAGAYSEFQESSAFELYGYADSTNKPVIIAEVEY